MYIRKSYMQCPTQRPPSRVCLPWFLLSTTMDRALGISITTVGSIPGARAGPCTTYVVSSYSRWFEVGESYPTYTYLHMVGQTSSTPVQVFRNRTDRKSRQPVHARPALSDGGLAQGLFGIRACVISVWPPPRPYNGTLWDPGELHGRTAAPCLRSCPRWKCWLSHLCRARPPTPYPSRMYHYGWYITYRSSLRRETLGRPGLD